MWAKVRHTLSTAWSWLKRYWTWLLFPVGLVLALVGYVAGARRDGGVDAPGGPRPEDVNKGWSEGDHALDHVTRADRERDEALAHLREENAARIRTLSEQQQKELDQLKERPIEEVVSWFDKL